MFLDAFFRGRSGQQAFAMKGRSFASPRFDAKKKQTRREIFLAQMDKVAPRVALPALIERHNPKEERPGRQPLPYAGLLRMHYLQQGYALRDPAMEEALSHNVTTFGSYEIELMRRFVGIELNEDVIPDESTILRFRRFLEEHGLAAKMLTFVNGQFSTSANRPHAPYGPAPWHPYPLGTNRRFPGQSSRSHPAPGTLPRASR